jgi:putative holliday junction resolvase
MHFDQNTTIELTELAMQKNIKHGTLAEINFNFKDASILALDYGTKKIGIATGAWPQNIGSPHGILYYQNRLERFQKLELVQSIFKARFFVLGLPLHADGLAHLTTLQALHFGLDLNRYFNTPVIWVDERFSSQVIKQNFVDHQKVDHDDQSAYLILDDFFQQQSNPDHLFYYFNDMNKNASISTAASSI